MAEVKTVEHLEASRLPEPKWGWRRALIFMVTIWAQALCTWMTWQVIQLAGKVVRGNDLAVLGIMTIVIKYGFYTTWAAMILYGVGASVTDVAQLASAVRTTRKETTVTENRNAGSLAASATSAGASVASAAASVAASATRAIGLGAKFPAEPPSLGAPVQPRS